MIINSARGTHSSPGVYTREIDVTYSVKSLGITSLGLAGETVKGPAFEPIKIEKWSDYVDYFGSTSTEKFVGTGYPKYELPYIAKEYLKESRQLYVCRVLGLSGYDAGKAWVVYANDGSNDYAAVVLRARAAYGEPSQGDPCTPGDGDVLTPATNSVTFTSYTETVWNGDCEEVTVNQGESGAELAKITDTSLGKFGVVANGKVYNVSLNYGDSDYIYNVLGSNPLTNTECPVFVEAVYDYALRKAHTDGKTLQLKGIKEFASDFSDYKQPFSPAVTPWILSQAHAIKNATGNGGVVNVSKLFRAWTISDGNHANNEVKISIQAIRPDAGTFDLVVRAMNDSDSMPVVLEKFSGCNLVVGDKNYVALRVGSVDGEYELKSKYIALEMADNIEDLSTSVPCGFLGYPLHDVSSQGLQNFEMGYNTKFDYNIKPKRQYFGFSDMIGIDIDCFNYKGIANTVLSAGFHLDSAINELGNKVTLNNPGTGEDSEYDMIAVDGKSGKNASVRIPRIVTEAYAKDTLYEDINTRKFTVCFYGGYDGWDIYRKNRTNEDAFKATKYSPREGGPIQRIQSGDFVYLDLPVNANNSDYYAYLGAYRQFANPEGIDINVFATPGLDWVNNELLVEDALDVIEDSEDGRGGDALYIITTPNKPKGATDATDDMYSPLEIVELLEASSIDTSYAATYWPWVKYFDADENLYINLPVTKDVIRNLAYTDNTSYPWFAPAGINRGDVNCVRATMKTKIGDEDTLYDGHVNPVKTFAVDGVKIWGNKTMYTVDSPLNRVNVRRLMIRIKKLIKGAGKQLIFDQYDTSLKNQFLSIVTPILANVKANRGISDYRIDIDDSAEARDQHTLPCTIHVKPTPTLEYIDLTFTIYPESVDFAE